MYGYGESAFLKRSAGCLCHITGGSAVRIHMEKGCLSVGLRKGGLVWTLWPLVWQNTPHILLYITTTDTEQLAALLSHVIIRSLLIFSTANWQFWSSFQCNKLKKLLNHKIHLTTSYTNGRSLWANSLCLKIREVYNQHVVVNFDIPARLSCNICIQTDGRSTYECIFRLEPSSGFSPHDQD